MAGDVTIGAVPAPDRDVGPAATAFAYTVVLLVVIIGPPMLPGEFPPYRLLRFGDVLDIVSPLVMIPAAWLLLRRAAGGHPSTGISILFVAIAAAWMYGQGMHLAANAIGHLVDLGAGDAYRLTHDLDEILSHVIWHAALIGVSILLVVQALQSPMTPASGASRGLVAGAALVYGFTFFAMVVEGGTGVLGIPAAVVVGVAGLAIARGTLIGRPIAATFVLGYLVALVLMVAWAAMNGWQLVEFSAKGLI